MQNLPSSSCSDFVKSDDPTRSDTTVIQSHIDIKSWLARLPSVDEARPARCPKCGTASCPIGAPIVIQGHGTRDRQVLGPSAPDARPAMIVIAVRRYRCTACGTVPVVVPREVRSRRLYSASAMALALALWGLEKMPSRAVRERVNPATFVAEPNLGWVTVRRWAKDIVAGKLFVAVPRPPPGSKLRHVAATAAAALAAHADALTRVCPLEHRAFVGAAHVT